MWACLQMHDQLTRLLLSRQLHHTISSLESLSQGALARGSCRRLVPWMVMSTLRGHSWVVAALVLPQDPTAGAQGCLDCCWPADGAAAWPPMLDCWSAAVPDRSGAELKEGVILAKAHWQVLLSHHKMRCSVKANQYEIASSKPRTRKV